MPVDRSGWRGFMRWTDLAFLHWPLPAAALRPLVPAALEIDTFDGDAWVGVVPFRMEATRLRWLPPIPTATDFPELNVRTYVRAGGRAGVWFFSLDAASRLAVFGARRFLGLPYFHAAMAVRADESGVHYESRRARAGGSAEFQASYRPAGPLFHSRPGTLVHWLTERYCLFGQRRSGLCYRLDIAHQPWPLRDGTADIERNTMAEPAGITLPPAAPLVHVADAPVDVRAWPPAPI
jgi:uncharacterized protein